MIIKDVRPFDGDQKIYTFIASLNDPVPYKGEGLPNDAGKGTKIEIIEIPGMCFIYNADANEEHWYPSNGTCNFAKPLSSNGGDNVGPIDEAATEDEINEILSTDLTTALNCNNINADPVNITEGPYLVEWDKINKLFTVSFEIATYEEVGELNIPGTLSTAFCVAHDEDSTRVITSLAKVKENGYVRYLRSVIYNAKVPYYTE